MIFDIYMSVGMVSCWVVDGKTRPMSTFSSNAQHNSEVTVLKWNPAGKRLITGDKVTYILFEVHIFSEIFCS